VLGDRRRPRGDGPRRRGLRQCRVPGRCGGAGPRPAAVGEGQREGRAVDTVNPMVRRMQQEARDNADAFWAREAERLSWFRKWDSVLDWTPPTFRWFSGAETNLSWNCLDRHVANGRAGHGAL